MELIVNRGGEAHRVRIDRGESGYEIEIDGELLAVDVAALGGSRRSLLLGGGEQWEVSVVVESAGVYHVAGRGLDERLELADPLAALAATSAGAADSARSIAAYMPGRVVALLVAEGDEVAAGQGVVVLEAMKMENEIQSEIDGVVGKIHVEAGQSVEGGDLLFEVDPR